MASKVKKRTGKSKSNGRKAKAKTSPRGVPLFKPNARDVWSMRNLGTRYILEGMYRDGVKSLSGNGRAYKLSSETDLESICNHRPDNSGGNGAVPIAKIAHGGLKALSKMMQETEEE